MSTKVKDDQDLSVAEYLERALDELNEAREEAAKEIRSMIDSAISRSREALDHLRSDADERAESIRAKAEERAQEWEHMLEDASDDARRELGIRTVRAQRSYQALKAMQDEIKVQEDELRSSS